MHFFFIKKTKQSYIKLNDQLRHMVEECVMYKQLHRAGYTIYKKILDTQGYTIYKLHATCGAQYRGCCSAMDTMKTE